jgi:hypothetical protein
MTDPQRKDTMTTTVSLPAKFDRRLIELLPDDLSDLADRVAVAVADARTAAERGDQLKLQLAAAPATDRDALADALDKGAKPPKPTEFTIAADLADAQLRAAALADIAWRRREDFATACVSGPEGVAWRADAQERLCEAVRAAHVSLSAVTAAVERWQSASVDFALADQGAAKAGQPQFAFPSAAQLGSIPDPGQPGHLLQVDEVLGLLEAALPPPPESD